MTKNSVFKIKKKPSKQTGLKTLYLQSLKKWTRTGRIFSADELVKFLHDYYQTLPGTETFPEDWEIIEYQLVETRSTNIDYFIKFKSSKPFIKGIK